MWLFSLYISRAGFEQDGVWRRKVGVGEGKSFAGLVEQGQVHFTLRNVLGSLTPKSQESPPFDYDKV
jgi:hypothetical protein